MAVFRRRQPLDGVEPEKLQLIFGMLCPFAVVREPFVTPNQDMTIADFPPAQGQAASKRQAEQLAAALLLETLERQ